jgi:hypothetical protein
MTRNQRIFILLQLGILIVVIIFVANGLSQVDFETSNSINWLAMLLGNFGSGEMGSSAPLPADDSSFALWRPLFWALLFFAVIYLIISPKYRRFVLRMFLTVVLLTIFLNQFSDRLQPLAIPSEEAASGGTAAEVETSLPEPPAFVQDPPNWFLWSFYALLALLFVVTAWYFWRRRRAEPDMQSLFVQEAETALHDLEAGGDLKNVVLRCYARMSDVLHEGQNIRRGRAMTPREFEQHLSEIGLRDEHIQRLTYMFEGVRYGARSTDRRTELEAADCLRAIVKTYGPVS